MIYYIKKKSNLFYIKYDKDPYIVLIPKGTLHGFLAVSENPAVLLNFPTALYDPQEESRIPYSNAQIKFPDGSLFNWEDVRKLFNS